MNLNTVDQLLVLCAPEPAEQKRTNKIISRAILTLMLSLLSMLPVVAFAGTTPFITTWQTTAANETVVIPTRGNTPAGQSYTVDWGDGSAIETINGGDPDPSHVYAAAGTYTVSMNGALSDMAMSGNATSQTQLQTIEAWGDHAWLTMGSSFVGSVNLTMPNVTDAPNLVNITDLNAIFSGASSLVTGNFAAWDVSNVVEFNNMFNNATLFNEDISGWDMTSAMDISNMFFNALAFNQPVGAWNVSSLELAVNAFRNADSFNQDLSGWNTAPSTTANLTNVSAMFMQTAVFNGNISNWDTSGVMNMSFMFANTSAFDQPINTNNTVPNPNGSGTQVWDTSNVTNMQTMFLSAVFNQPLNFWDTGSVLNMSNMFNNADVFNQDITGWDVSSVENFRNMFISNDAFTANLSGWDVGAGTDFQAMFQNSVNSTDVSTWNMSSAINISNMFRLSATCDRDVSAWQVQNVTNATDAFTSCTTPMAPATYDALLNAWNALALQNGVPLGAQQTCYTTNGQAAHMNMDTADSWTFNDAGLCPSPPPAPTCTTVPSPAGIGVAVTTTCTGVEDGATLTIPNMSCTPTPADATGTVTCTGTVGAAAPNVFTSNDTVTVTSAGGSNTSATTGLVIDTTPPATPVCTTTPNPASDGTAVTTTCTGVEDTATLTIQNMTCNPTPATATGQVVCTGNVGPGATDVSVPSDTVTVTDTSGNANTSADTGLVIDNTAPAAPVCTTTPSPASDGTAITTTCTGVEAGAVITIPNMTCGAEALGQVVCTGTVGTGPGDVAVGNDAVTITDAQGNSDSSAVTGLVIDNTPPAGPATLSSPTSPTNNTAAPLTGACGADAAGGTVTITTVAPNAFAPYPATATLDASGNFNITGLTWVDGTYDVIVACTDALGNGPTNTTITPVTIDSTAPSGPTCTTTPAVANNGTPVTTTCNNIEPGATVTIPNMTCTPTPADATGVATCTGTVGPGAGDVATNNDTVTVTDTVGNTDTSATTGLTIDNTAPAGPATLSSPTSPTNDAAAPLTGSCGTDAAGGSVTITTTPTNGFTPFPATATLDALGEFNITGITWTDGTYAVNVACTDEAGNGPTSSTITPVVIDTTAPATPVCNSTPSPANPGDLVTTTCTGVEDGATLTIPNMTCTPTPADPTGVVVCTATAGSAAPDVFTANDTVTVTDPAGNANTSATTGLVLDTTPPTAPTINPVSDADTEVTGTAEPGATLDLSPLVCDNAPVVADAAGEWTCDVSSSAPLTAGDPITATATDASGNTSPPANTVVSGAGAQATPTIDPSDGTVVTGTGEAGDTITVTDPSGATICTAVVAANGTWSCTPATPIPAGTVIDATATDPTTGNVSAPVSTTISSPAQIIPPVLQPTNGASVTGTTLYPNAPIEILDPVTGAVLCSTTSDAQGNFTCAPLSPQPASGDPLNVTVAPNGVPSAPATTTVDALPPTAPSVNPFTEGDAAITGTAEPGDTIDLAPIVCANAPVVADQFGNWTCDAPAPAPVAGDTIMATATDPAGNVSAPAQSPVTGAGGVVPPTIYPTDGSNVSGIGIPGNTITVTDAAGNALCTATVDANGLWSCTPSPMPAIGDVVNAIQEDPSGNASAPAPTTVLDPSQITSPPPVIQDSDGTVIDGGGIPGDTIIVKDASGAVVCTAVVDMSGNWTCTPQTPLSVGAKLFANAIDPITGSASGPAEGNVVNFFEPIGVRTGLDGGAGSINGIFALLLGLLVLARKRRRVILPALLASLALAMPAVADDLDQAGTFYIGLNGGVSFVEPDPGTSNYVIDEDTSEGFKLTLGYNFTDHLAIEAFWADLGEATLLGDGSAQFPDGAIEYSIPGIGLRYTLPLADRFNVSAIIGVGQLDNTGVNIPFEQVEDTQVFAGLGAEYMLGDRLSVLGQYDYFDKDAQLASLGLRYRFGGKRHEPVKKVGKPISKPISKPVAKPPMPAPVAVAPTPQPVPAPAMVDQCQSDVNAILQSNNIYFDSGSANIANQSLGVLSQISASVSACPDARILIGGHTDSQGSEASNQRLSEARARAVAQYLVENGVSGNRIGVRGFGESQPIADNNTAEGRAANRRIEMRLSN